MSRIRSNRVCFTLNNYDIEDLEILLGKENDENIVYMVVGQEIGESGTPHLQGFIHIKEDPKKCGIKFWKDYFKFSQKAHFENARGSDEDNLKYCSKDGPVMEVGKPGVVGISRFQEIFETARESVEDAIKLDYEFGIRHFNQLRAINAMFGGSKPEFEYEGLLDWQKKAMDMLDRQTNRQILFIVDEEGGKGKTTLAQYLGANFNVCYMNGGKHADLVYAFSKNKNCDYVIFDLARNTVQDYWPYNMMEQLKNGWMTSTKYDSVTICTKWKKILVLCNEDPDRTKLSKDRYVILKI